MKINPALRTKLENLLAEMGYRVRFEKGNFRGGECLVEAQKMVVINKFYPLETQVNTLIEVVLKLPVQPETLSPESQKLLVRLQKEAALAASPEDALPEPDSPETSLQ
jgi:hypothetical protein